MTSTSHPTPWKQWRTFLGFLVAVLSAQLAWASEIYEYQGNDYTFASGPYTTSMAISGDFTVATPLSPNLVGYIFTPLTFDFTDGVLDLNNLDSNITDDFFQVSTDALGGITGTVIYLNIYNLPPFQGNPQNDHLQIYDPDGDTAADLIFFPDGNVGLVGEGTNPTPGQWTGQSASSTPEPASISLLLTGGLAGLWLWKRRNL